MAKRWRDRPPSRSHLWFALSFFGLLALLALLGQIL